MSIQNPTSGNCAPLLIRLPFPHHGKVPAEETTR